MRLQFSDSMHLPQQPGWLRGEALVHNSKFVSADNKVRMKMSSTKSLIRAKCLFSLPSVFLKVLNH